MKKLGFNSSSRALKVIRIDLRSNESIIQKILIARSIINKPKLLLIENQMSSFEENDRIEIVNFLTDKKNGWTMITISNDRYMQEKCDETIQMNKGSIIKTI